MNKLFDVVVLSADIHSGFLDYAPMVVKAWKKLFDCKIVIGILDDEKSTSDNFGADRIIKSKILPEIPIQAQTKLFRDYLCCIEDSNKVYLVNDMDWIPLAKWYFDERLSQRKYGELCAITCDNYYIGVDKKFPTAKKFPIANTTGEGFVFRELYHIANLQSFDLFIESLIHTEKVFDDHENLLKDNFSHESLIRVLLYGIPNRVKLKRVPGEVYPFSNKIIDRGRWGYNKKKLYSGYYFASHMLRPYSENIDELLVLEQYIDSL